MIKMLKKVKINSKEGGKIIVDSARTGEMGVMKPQFRVFESSFRPAITDMHLVKDAKKYITENFEEGVVCPCCDQFVKLYRRQINVTMAKMLIKFYQMNQDEQRWYHISEITGSENTSGGDFAKLRFWGLVEEMEKDPDDTETRTSGMWRITERGKLFARGELMVERYARIFNQKLYRMEGEMIDIRHSLGKRFDYEELMKG